MPGMNGGDVEETEVWETNNNNKTNNKKKKKKEKKKERRRKKEEGRRKKKRPRTLPAPPGAGTAEALGDAGSRG